MMRALAAAALIAAWTGAAHAEDRLAPLAFLQGCWIGAFAEPEELRDERCATRMYDGAYLRDVHTVVGTDYGGETIYRWNPETQRIELTYYASDGAVLTGHVVEAGEAGALMEGRYLGADGSVQLLRSRWEKAGPDNYTVITETGAEGEWRELMRIAFERAP